MMDSKSTSIFLLIVACQLVSSSTRIPLPQESFLERISYSLNHFREVYSLFPCSDKLMVEKLFNIFNEVRAPKISERLETEEAEMELLYHMIFGKSTNVPLTRWYLIFEKTVDAFDRSLPYSEDRMKLNERIIHNYLTPVQIKRLNIFTRMLQPDVKPTDVKTMLTYLYGTPIGLALGIHQEVITHILEEHNSMEEVAGQLGKAAIDLCRPTYPTYEYNEHIVRDLMKTMLMKNS